MSTEIYSYIPQRPPFIMIGEVVSSNEKYTETTFTIPEENIFVVNGCFTESGLIENMAQTAAANTGYKANKEAKPAPVGYIAALKNINIIRLPKANETITTQITLEQVVMGFHLVKAKVINADIEIANCEFKIFLSPEQAGKHN